MTRRSLVLADEVAQSHGVVGGSTRDPYWQLLREAFLRDQRSRHTAQAYRTALEDFFRHARAYPDQVRRAHVIAWKESLLGRGLAPKSVNLKLCAVSSFFRWLDQERDISIANPSRGVKRLRGDSVPRRISYDALAGVLAHLESDPPQMRRDTAARDLAILETLYATGARRAEILGIRGADVTFDARRVYSAGEARSPYLVKLTVKGGEVREMEIPEDVVALIDRYLARVGRPRLRHLAQEQPGAYLFQTVSGRRIVPASFARVCKSHAVRAGFRAEDFCLHGIRAAVAQDLEDDGAPLREIQDQLGHKDPATTAGYLRKLAGGKCYRYGSRRARLGKAIEDAREVRPCA